MHAAVAVADGLLSFITKVLDAAYIVPELSIAMEKKPALYGGVPME
jgi:hypothetical protein